MDWDTLGSDPEGMDLMQVRSWMAAGVLAAVTLGGWASGVRAGQPVAVKQKVNLSIHIAGTTPNAGVEVIIKPAHPACKFKPITCPVKQDGMLQDIPPIEVETLSADRDCTFAIVLKEPGQPEKTFRRSLQLNPPSAATGDKPQALMCYISSRMVASKVSGGPSTPVATKPAADATRKR